METQAELIRTYIQEIIRPRVQADGGEIDFLSLEDGLLTLKVQAECSKCPLTKSCLKDWILKELNRQFGVDLRLKALIVKPYFWDRG